MRGLATLVVQHLTVLVKGVNPQAVLFLFLQLLLDVDRTFHDDVDAVVV